MIENLLLCCIQRADFGLIRAFKEDQFNSCAPTCSNLNGPTTNHIRTVHLMAPFGPNRSPQFKSTTATCTAGPVNVRCMYLHAPCGYHPRISLTRERSRAQRHAGNFLKNTASDSTQLSLYYNLLDHCTVFPKF